MNIEKLESRQMFNAAVTSAIPDISGGVSTVDLSSHFDDTNTYVALDFGNNNVIDIRLRNETPITKQNFLNYVNRGAYNNSIIHRAVPNFVIQGGGFTLGTNSTINTIPTDPPIQNEFTKDTPINGEVNVRGTVSMAKLGSSPDSATDQFFISVADNASNLDTQNGGFTVFGDVVGGMPVADAISNLQTTDASVTLNNSAFTELPLITSSDGTTSNFVVINSASVVSQPLTFSAVSDNANVVRASVTGGSLTLNYPGAGAGTAHVTVTATSLDGSTVSNTFTVTRADINGPTAVVATPAVAFDNSSFTFNVTYTDNVAVNASTIDSNDIAVTGPHGFSQIATLVSSGLANNSSVVATYKITSPKGVFSTADGGIFTFLARNNQVLDTTGNPLALGSIGSANLQFIAIASRPDLVGSIKAITPTTLLPGAKNNAATVVIRNAGISAAKGNVAVNVYASVDGTLPGAILLTTVNARLNLSKGQTLNVPVTYKTPSVGKPANYHLIAFLDADSELNESNENNNLVVGGVVKISPPSVDLKVTLGKLPTKITAGKKTTIPVTIKNNGNTEARGNTVIRVAASTDRIADVNDSVLITLPAKIDIKPGASATLTVTFTPNKSVTPKGMEYLGAQAIFNGSPAEANPADNIVFSTKTILFA